MLMPSVLLWAWTMTNADAAARTPRSPPAASSSSSHPVDRHVPTWSTPGVTKAGAVPVGPPHPPAGPYVGNGDVIAVYSASGGERVKLPNYYGTMLNGTLTTLLSLHVSCTHLKQELIGRFAVPVACEERHVELRCAVWVLPHVRRQVSLSLSLSLCLSLSLSLSLALSLVAHSRSLSSLNGTN